MPDDTMMLESVISSAFPAARSSRGTEPHACVGTASPPVRHGTYDGATQVFSTAGSPETDDAQLKKLLSSLETSYSSRITTKLTSTISASMQRKQQVRALAGTLLPCSSAPPRLSMTTAAHRQRVRRGCTARNGEQLSSGGSSLPFEGSRFPLCRLCP